MGKHDDEKPKLLPYQLAIALLLIVIPAALAYFIFFRQPPKANHVRLKQRSLVVLPFRNLKQEAKTDFLGIALANEIIARLSDVSALTVRPSSFTHKYRGRDIEPKRVAVELNVNTLLSGIYIKEGDNLRITTQLVDVLTNETLWKEAIELKYENLMMVQDRLTQQVIQNLQLPLTATETERLKREVPQNLQAYECYLRGVDLYTANRLPQAIAMLEKSLVLDSNYARAWSQLGAVYTAQSAVNFDRREDYDLAQQAYQKALALNPEQNEARIALATLLTNTNRAEEAVPLLREVLKTNPALAQAHKALSYTYRFAGMLQEAMAEAEQALPLEAEINDGPSVPAAYLYAGQYEKFLAKLPPDNVEAIKFYRGLGLYYLKDFARALIEFKLAYQPNNESLQASVSKALALTLTNELAASLTQLRETEKIAMARGVYDAEGFYKMAQVYAVLGDKEAALRLLRYSLEGGFFCYSYFANDPLLNNLQSEAEFARLLQMAQQRHEKFRQRFFPS